MNTNQLSAQANVLKQIVAEIKQIKLVVDNTTVGTRQGNVRAITRPKFSQTREILSNAVRTTPLIRQPQQIRQEPAPPPPLRINSQQQNLQQPQPKGPSRGVASGGVVAAAAKAIKDTDFEAVVRGMLSNILKRDVAEQIRDEALDKARQFDELDDIASELRKKFGDAGRGGGDGGAPTPPPADGGGNGSGQPPAGPKTIPVRASPAGPTTRQVHRPGPNDVPPKPSGESQSKPPTTRSKDLGTLAGSVESGGDYARYHRGTVWTGKIDPKTGKEIQKVIAFDEKGNPLRWREELKPLQEGGRPVLQPTWTIGEILKGQKDKDPKTRLFAVGKYQFIPGTFASVFNSLKQLTAKTSLPITEDTVFDINTQDLFFQYSKASKSIDGKSIYSYYEKDAPTEKDLRDAALVAATTWAGLPVPYQVYDPPRPEFKNGKRNEAPSLVERIVGWPNNVIPLGRESKQSYYIGANKAGATLGELLDSLKADRDQWQKKQPAERQSYFKALGLKFPGSTKPPAPKTETPPVTPGGKPIDAPSSSPGNSQTKPPTGKDPGKKAAELVPTDGAGEKLAQTSENVASKQNEQQSQAAGPPVVNVVDNSTVVNENKRSAPRASSPATIYSSLT